MDKLKEHMLKTFTNAQQVAKFDDSVDEIIYRLKKLYKKPQFKQYIESLYELSYSIIHCSETSHYTRRLLEFLSRIIQKFSKEELIFQQSNHGKKPTEKDDGEDDLVAFDDEIFESDKFILRLSEFTRDPSIDVRVNTCRLLKNIFEGFDQIDESIYKQIQDNISYTSTDKEARVRANGLLALGAVTNSENDTINKKKQFIAKYDPEVTVRVCAFKTLVARPDNVNIFMFGINDNSPSVQRLCYQRIFRDFDFEWFTEEQICRIFRTAFYSNNSKELFASYIPKLIAHSENGLVDLVSHFNLRNDSEFVVDLLKEFYKHLHTKRAFEPMVREFRDIYFDENAMPKTPNLRRHVLLVWRTLVEICKELKIVILDNNDKTTLEDNEGETEEAVQIDLCDIILPDLLNFCEFFERFVNFHIQQTKGKKLSSSESEDLSGSLVLLIEISDLYAITDFNRPMLMDFCQRIILRKDVFFLFKKYLKTFVPRMFRNWSEAEADEAFAIIENIIEELQQRCENLDEKHEELQLDRKTLAQWVSSIYHGFTRSEFLLNLDASSYVLTKVFEYGVEIVTRLSLDSRTRVSIREGLGIIHSLVFLNPRSWSQLAESVLRFFPDQDNVEDLNLLALEIVLDVTCLLKPERLELQYVYGEDAMLELSTVESEKERSLLMLEDFFLNFLEYEPKSGEKHPLAIRHMTFKYRIYRSTVKGLCRYIIVRSQSTVKWYSALITTYLSNTLIDDGLYTMLETFVEHMFQAMKNGQLDPLTFVEAYPMIAETIVVEQNCSAQIQENAMVFFVNICSQLGVQKNLALEIVNMFESSDSSKLSKFNLTVLNDMKSGLMDEEELSWLNDRIKEFSDEKLVSTPARKRPRTAKKKGKGARNDDDDRSMISNSSNHSLNNAK